MCEDKGLPALRYFKWGRWREKEKKEGKKKKEIYEMATDPVVFCAFQHLLGKLLKQCHKSSLSLKVLPCNSYTG